MHSPRFRLREDALTSIFSANNIKRIWRNSVRNVLRNDIVADPLEYLDYHVHIQAVCNSIEKAICSGSYIPGRTLRMRMEKSKGLCRLIVIPSVEDALVLQTLSTALYADIKGKAPSTRSYFAPSDNVFSRDAGLFGDPQYGSFRAWLDFQKHLFEFSKNRPYVIITDIANYYDSISYIHLRNIVSGLLEIRESVLDMLIYVLSGMLWQPDYMPRIEIGLPQINIDAPRILAHSFLYELDEYLEKHFKGDFVRYMDDINIGADSIPEAKAVLRDIDMILQTRQVRLNSGKTSILTKREAAEHFRVRENRILDQLQARLDLKSKAHKPIDRECRKLAASFRYLYSEKRFDAGNGEKILKRILHTASKVKCVLDEDAVMDVIERRPNVRVSAIKHVTCFGLTPSFLRRFRECVQRGIFVDDVSIVEGAKAIVEAPSLRNDDGIRSEIGSLVEALNTDNVFSVYSSLWMASKYLNARDVYKLIYASKDVWLSNAWLGRVVGGLWPYVWHTDHQKEYQSLVERTRNQGALMVLEFLKEIGSDEKKASGIRKFIVAENTSKPLKITHSKFTMLLCILGNPNVPDRKKKEYILSHKPAWTDVYYRATARRLVAGSLTQWIQPSM